MSNRPGWIMDKKKLIKGIISYILGLALTVVFALYMNANVGWFMLIALILALILSVFFAWLTRKNIHAECNMEEAVLSKGDYCELKVTLYNKSLFPTTPLEIIVLQGDGVKTENKNIIASIFPFSKREYTIRYTAKICGLSTIGIESINVTDYLGLFAFQIPGMDYDKLHRKIAVIPEIADVSVQDDRILQLMQSSLADEDGEDTIESTFNTFGGFPGYDSREYVPGDPIKRINWKQSAKRNKLLVRLDDEMAAKNVNVILDSVFSRHTINTEEIRFLSAYKDCAEDEILPKVAEDAIENALGIIRALVQNSYSVNFYVHRDGLYHKYEIEDDKDIEAVRLGLAEYVFSQRVNIDRLPGDDILDKNSPFIYSTPNRYEDVNVVLEYEANKSVIFSAVDEALQNDSQGTVTIEENKPINKPAATIGKIIRPMIIPYVLAVTLSVIVFSAFRIEVFSFWTVVQALVCAGIFALCTFVKKHKVIGGLMITILVVGVLSSFTRIIRYEPQYLQWFMSGGDVVPNITAYLTTLVLIFTVLFSMVIYYYTQVKYRTSAMLLISILPFVVYVKIIREIETVYVMLIIVLNVTAFLINTRKQRDKDKKIIGYKTGLVSVAMYATFFILIALAVPKSSNTRYYHLFEDAFLGGNTTVTLPGEYSSNSEFSGNADNFNQLNNRKLFVVYSEDEINNPIYLRKQVFDYYDYVNDRWYGDENYSEYSDNYEKGIVKYNSVNIGDLLEVLKYANTLDGEFLAKYGLSELTDVSVTEDEETVWIKAQNFMSDFYVIPTRWTDVYVKDREITYMTMHGIMGSRGRMLDRYVTYQVTFYDEFESRKEWINTKASDMDTETAVDMLTELAEIIQKSDRNDYISIVNDALVDAKFAVEYEKSYENNIKGLSDKMSELAYEITKDCKYDWEKAEAIERYFREENFVYDLEYNAVDDSVDFFVFESKRGTCSDFATAYVLLARAAGLTVRYVEGFVPDREIGRDYDVEYVVRTKCAHAYPEVYIQNYGFVVYEPTVASVDGNINANGAVGFVLTLGYRLLLIFALISVLIIFIIFIVKIFAPYVRERIFIFKVRKATPEKAVVMLYQRLQNINGGVESYTPYEYALYFENVIKYDISELVWCIERASYMNENIDTNDKKLAIYIYKQALRGVKKFKRHNRHKREKE